jgi:hypothetical protein
MFAETDQDVVAAEAALAEYRHRSGQDAEAFFERVSK